MEIAIYMQLLINGVLLGGLYALIAFGLSIIYGVARILNFAHGTMLTMVAITAAIIFDAFQWSVFLIMAVLIPAGFLFGLVFYRWLLNPLSRREPHQRTIGTVLVTVGSLIIMSDVAAVAAGAEQRNIRVPTQYWEFGGVIVSGLQIAILMGVIASVVALHFFLKKSWIGLAIRSVAQNPFGAAITGVNGTWVSTITFALGTAIVACAGMMYVLIFPVDPYSGFPLTVKAFSIILLGGIGNLPGTLLAGLFLGVAESATAYFWAPQWAPALSVVIVLGFLLFFPGLVKMKRAA